MNSLRGNLVVATTAATTLILGTLSLVIFLQVRATLNAEFDASLRSKAAALTAFVDADDGQLHIDDDAAQMPEFSRKSTPDYYQLSDHHNHIVRSNSLQGATLTVPANLSPEPFQTTLVTLPDGNLGRAGILTFHLHDEGNQHNGETPTTLPFAPQNANDLLTLVVARDESTLRHTLSRIGWTLALLCALAIILSAAMLTWLVSRTMRVVDRLALQLSLLEVRDLSQRITLHDAPAELHPVVDTVNGLLTRLGEAFNRERAFSADVAHELRTPLATLQTTLDVALRRPMNDPNHRTTLTRCQAATRQMRILVDNLLTMARAEGGQLLATPQPVDIQNILNDCWIPFADRAHAKNITLESNPSTEIRSHTDPEKLAQILRNLFDNAVSYTPDGGRIQWTSSASPDHWHFTLRNSGCILDPTQITHVFDRFWRAQQSRTDSESHAGLGLSLSRRLAELLGGTLTASRDGDDFAITLILPLNSPTPQLSPTSLVVAD